MNPQDIADMKRLSKASLPKPMRVVKRFNITGVDDVSKNSKKEAVKSKNTKNAEKIKWSTDIDKDTMDFLEFARDQGAFDW